MNILQILFHNFGSHSRTRKPENKVPYPDDFRGELNHRADQCVLCGTCVYVCSPAAIEIDREEENGYWNYDGGRCTFCGRCVEYCPTHALQFANQSAPIVTQRSSEFKNHYVEYQHCKKCGRLIIPIPRETLVRLYRSEEAANHAMQLHDLCENCRRSLSSQLIKAGISGNKE